MRSIKNFIISKPKKYLKSKKLRLSFFILISIFLVFSLAYLLRGLIFVAFVNGKPITRLEVIKNLEKQSGKIVLDDIITKELINQEAKKRGILITQETIDEEIDRIKNFLKEQGMTLDIALSYEGQTMDDLRDNIRLQKQVEEMINSEIQIDDDEVLKYFENNKEFFNDKDYNDVKEEIRKDLRQQKLDAKFAEFMQKLKNDSDIKYIVNYSS